MLPALDSLLEYQNPKVLKLYEQNSPDSKLSSEVAFREMLKYLWLAKKHSLEAPDHQDDPAFPRECYMPRSMQEIDEMWHEFILFTRDYMDFCEQYFGEFIHHVPNIFQFQPLPRAQVDHEVEVLLNYIYDNLGAESVKIWFASYLDPEPSLP